jgi:DNA gyrase/topoisomerase IV subunit A
MIDYKQKYIESSAEVKALTKQLQEVQKIVDKQTKKLDKAVKTRKPREATFRNKRIGEIIRELKQNQPELTNPQRMTEANRLYDIEVGKMPKPLAVPVAEPSASELMVAEAARLNEGTVPPESLA